MIPDDLVRLARVQRDAFDLENRGAEAAASESLALEAEALAENDPPEFGRRFEAIRTEIRDRRQKLPSTAYWSAWEASTEVGVTT